MGPLHVKDGALVMTLDDVLRLIAILQAKSIYQVVVESFVHLENGKDD